MMLAPLDLQGKLLRCECGRPIVGFIWPGDVVPKIELMVCACLRAYHIHYVMGQNASVDMTVLKRKEV